MDDSVLKKNPSLFAGKVWIATTILAMKQWRKRIRRHRHQLRKCPWGLEEKYRTANMINDYWLSTFKTTRAS